MFSFMETASVIDRIRARAADIRGRGVTGMYLFGSRVRSEQRDDSDLDAFIDIDASRKFSLVDLVNLERLLEEELGMRVDLTTRNSISPYARSRIEAEAVRVL
jgi:predicted nucleotidyltransferase